METEGEYLVSDQPRPWPNVAKEARDRAAEEAVRGIRLLGQAMTNIEHTDVDGEDRYLIAKALICFERIARLLESVGAQTRP